jgi:hypothetical protein
MEEPESDFRLGEFENPLRHPIRNTKKKFGTSEKRSRIERES